MQQNIAQLLQQSNRDLNITEPERIVELLLDGDYIERVIQICGQAKKRIWFMAYTWKIYENSPEKPIQQLNYNIAQKCGAGLDVRALVYSPAQAESLRMAGVTTRTMPTLRVLHTKAILVDDIALVIGSHNLTEKGTSENYEASVMVRDAACIYDFEQYFLGMWNNFSE